MEDPSAVPSSSSSVSSSSSSNNSGIGIDSNADGHEKTSGSTLRHRSTGTNNTATTTDNSKNKTKTNTVVADPTWSANIVFYPPSSRLWRIGRQWYDLTDFLDLHPGGRQLLELARDRFEDATFAFEAHHHNYEKARRVLDKYKLPPAEQARANAEARRRPSRAETQQADRQHLLDGYPHKPHHDPQLDSGFHPQLLDHDAFYSVLRRRVSRYLASVGCHDGEPTYECLVIFWTTFILWCLSMTMLYTTGKASWVLPTALISAVLGAFGHNWVHQPKYKEWGWALLSLDTIGFSSEGWYRDHLLHHHMFTNTPWDHHYFGTDPFLKTDPTTSRNFVQAKIMPHLFHIILCFGTYGNYLIHGIHLIQGQEVWSIGKSFFFVEHALFYHKWGVHGLLLLFGMQSIIANYYFTMALMNHNAEHCLDVKARNSAIDWGQAQLISSADWSVHLSFRKAMLFLWLNFHTVHHCKYCFSLAYLVSR